MLANHIIGTLYFKETQLQVTYYFESLLLFDYAHLILMLPERHWNSVHLSYTPAGGL